MAEGEACPQAGAVACPAMPPPETYAPFSLRCASGTWTFLKACDTGDACDPKTGQCATPFEGCSGKQPGKKICIDPKILGECTGDLFTPNVLEKCLYGCSPVGICKKCSPGSCQGPSQKCVDGFWQPEKCP